MQGVPAIYMGRIVEKEHFRTFIYAPDGSSKLVESWDEYERHMETGVWFATVEDAKSSVKPKRVRKEVKKDEPIELAVSADVPMVEVIESCVEVVDDEPLIEEEMIPVEPEVVDVKKNDDFLPKGKK